MYMYIELITHICFVATNVTCLHVKIDLPSFLLTHYVTCDRRIGVCVWGSRRLMWCCVGSAKTRPSSNPISSSLVRSLVLFYRSYMSIKLIYIRAVYFGLYLKSRPFSNPISSSLVRSESCVASLIPAG
jgi:hypothetical protein